MFRLISAMNGLLLLFLILALVRNVEVPELVHGAVLVGGDHAQPVADVVLLEELLGEVLEVALGHGNLGGDGDLGLVASHLHVLTEHT